MVLTCHWWVVTCRRRNLARCLRPIVALPMQWNSMVQRTEHFGLRRSFTTDLIRLMGKAKAETPRGV